MTTILHFVRHGAVDNPREVYYGRLPGFHLSPEGRRQAAAAAQALAGHPITAIYTSPLERARETAELIAAPLGLPVQTSQALIEVHSPCDGQPIEAMLALSWDLYTGSPDGYEQLADVQARALKLVQHLRQAHPGQQVVAVTHSDLIAVLLLWVEQMPLTVEQKPLMYQRYLNYATIHSLSFETQAADELPHFTYTQP
jgi:broad specificity phosphatase PhoE